MQTTVCAGPVSAVGSVSRFAFGSLQVGFLGPAHSFTTGHGSSVGSNASIP